MRCYLVLLFTVVLGIQVGQAWCVNITALFDNTSYNLTLGYSENATDGFDKDLDVPIPPPLPGQEFYAYFKINDTFDKMLVDYKNRPSWNLIIKTKYPVKLVWDTPPIPLQMTFDGEQVDMVNERTIELTAGNYNITISEYTPTKTTTPAGNKTPGFELFLTIVVLLLVMFRAKK